MTLPFSIQAQAGPARLARIDTAHGDVETPAFMPVGTAGTVKAVPQDVLEDLVKIWARRSFWAIPITSTCGRGMSWCASWAACTSS